MWCWWERRTAQFFPITSASDLQRFSFLPWIFLHLSISKLFLNVQLLIQMTVLHSTKLGGEECTREHNTLQDAQSPLHSSRMLHPHHCLLHSSSINGRDALVWAFLRVPIQIILYSCCLYAKLLAWETSVGKIKHWRSHEYLKKGSNKRKRQATLIGCATSLAYNISLCLWSK